MGRFYKIDTQGKMWLQRVSGVPAWTAADEGRILYDTLDTTSPVYIGGSSDWLAAGQYGDVPLGTTLLMETDVATLGYSLLTDQDDKVIYLTKGSAAGGAAGGSVQGTETFPNHTHAAGSFTQGVSGATNSLPAHTHGPGAGSANFMRSSPGGQVGESGDSYGTFTATGSAGSGTTHTHSGGTVTGTSGNQSAAITWATWKPRGINFTRQERI
jgi:hypothetical protein